MVKNLLVKPSSVLSQTHKNWELIVVNDGSTDNSEKIINYYCINDNRIQYIQHKKNKGIPSARNTGIRVSKEEYIEFLKQDDFQTPKKIEKQIKLFEKNKNNRVGLIFSNVLKISIVRPFNTFGPRPAL